MNIVMVGGRRRVDFLAKSLLSKGHRITIIHNDEDFCKFLSRTHDATVVCGDGSKPYILEDANIEGADILIALTPKDADNLVICELAKKVFGVKRAFATVSNPRSVEVFKKLGINTVISATHMVAEIIEQMAAINEIANYIPLEQGRIVMLELSSGKTHLFVIKTVAELAFQNRLLLAVF